MTCPECKMEVPQGARKCGHCGSRIIGGAERTVGIIFALTAICVFWATCDTKPPASAPDLSNVVYSLTGTARTASITIQNPTGGSEQHTVKVPWKWEFLTKSGSFVYVSAQNESEGSLTATIIVNGKLLQQATTTERFGIATASGSAR